MRKILLVLATQILLVILLIFYFYWSSSTVFLSMDHVKKEEIHTNWSCKSKTVPWICSERHTRLKGEIPEQFAKNFEKFALDANYTLIPDRYGHKYYYRKVYRYPFTHSYCAQKWLVVDSKTPIIFETVDTKFSLW
jgi:hypothetical protein